MRALDVVLKPGKVIHGRVVDTAGKPVAGAEVSYDGLADRNGIFNGRTIEWRTQTDANGEFIWDSAPDKAINLTITKSGYMTLEWARVETDTTNVTSFTLSSSAHAQGCRDGCGHRRANCQIQNHARLAGWQRRRPFTKA